MLTIPGIRKVKYPLASFRCLSFVEFQILVSNVYYDVGFSENVNYSTYLKMFCFKHQVQSEVLCLKESEQSYYSFLCSDLLTVTGNQIILNYDLMYRQESMWKTTKKKYEITTRTTKSHYFIF